MHKILVGLALAFGALGALLTSEAMIGVAVIAFACLLGIIGRILQADAHHRELVKRRQAD